MTGPGWRRPVLLSQAAVPSSGRVTGNAARSGRIGWRLTPDSLHRPRACQQCTRCDRPLSIRPGLVTPNPCTSPCKPLPLPMERHDPCRSGVPKPPRRPIMPDGGGILELAHRCEGQSAISRPHPRLRQCHGSKGDLPRVFTADTLIAQAIKIKASLIKSILA